MVSVATLSTPALGALMSVLPGWTTWTAYQSGKQPSATPFIALLAALTLWAVFLLGSEFPGVSTVSL